MRQNPRVEPPSQLAPAIVLHPVLSTALAHLDIQLEDELARYRRQRTGAERAVRQPGRQRSSESLSLIAVANTGKHAPPPQPVPLLEERLTGVAEPSIASDAYKPIPAFTATPQPFEGAIALRGSQSSTHDTADSGALPREENAYALAQTSNPKLDDYLESSEELLRSLADEQAEVQAERNFMRSLLTPLGLGAMLLLLLSSAMFGYVIMNPSTLPWLTAKQNNSPAGSPPGATSGTTAIAPPQPDLTKPQLPELNLNNLGTATVKSGSTKPDSTSSTTSGAPTPPTPGTKPTVAATIAPVSQPNREPAASTQPSTPAASSSNHSYMRPEAPSVAPRSAPPAPASIAPPVRRVPPTAPAPAASSPSQNSSGSSSYQYNVGIPFENDQTLEAARKVVPDAFVRTLPNGSTIVQVGVAHDQAEGQANAQKLRDQGLSSTDVYKR